MSLKRFAVAGLLVTALTASACFLGGCIEDENTDIVGDWKTIFDDDDGLGIEITTISALGDSKMGGFLKVENFWIESWESNGVWRTSNDTLYKDFGEYGVDTMLYKISGNRITISLCEGGICNETTVAERVDLKATRNRILSASTIRYQDPALFTSATYPDLMWYLEDNEDEFFDFDMMYFWDGERYFGKIWYDYPVWYTAGSRIFLIGMNGGGKVEQTVELEYNLTDDRLSIRPVLEDGLGPEDIWLPAHYYDPDWGLYKSKHGKKTAKKRRPAFMSTRPYRTASKI